MFGNLKMNRKLGLGTGALLLMVAMGLFSCSVFRQANELWNSFESGDIAKQDLLVPQAQVRPCAVGIISLVRDE